MCFYPLSPKQSINDHKCTLNAFLTLMPLCRTKPEAVDVTFAGEIIIFQPKEGAPTHPNVMGREEKRQV